MAIVRPEYGPTLNDLAGDHWRRLPRALRIGLAALLALIVVGAIADRIRVVDDGKNSVVVRGKVDFNLAYLNGIHKVAPQAGEELRLQTSSGPLQSYAVKPITLPPYKGDSSNGFLIATATMADQMRKADPNFVYRGEGRARINDNPGYQLLYTTKVDGKTVYGRRLLLVPGDPAGAREGADITMLAARTAAVVNVDAVGNNGQLKTPLRSFRFGTERP